MVPDTLFCYGTLRHDVPNSRFDLLDGHVAFIGRGRVHGRLYDLGDYPGLRLLPGGNTRIVHGLVYRLKDPASTIPLLDDYEGCGPANPMPHEYRRIVMDVETDGGILPAWVYVCTDTCNPRSEIRPGDYHAFLTQPR